MNLISKKDLLAMTGISYGQLYRWKRAKLIPEDWFVKQSSYTGQETFFPREQIISRIQSILEAKDQYSLEELAKIFSPEVTSISIKELSRIEEVNSELIPFIESHYKKENYQLMDITMYVAISESADHLQLSAEQAIELIKKCDSIKDTVKNINAYYRIFKVREEYHLLFLSLEMTIQFDSDIEVLDTCSLNEIATRLKVKYKSEFK